MAVSRHLAALLVAAIALFFGPALAEEPKEKGDLPAGLLNALGDEFRTFEPARDCFTTDGGLRRTTRWPVPVVQPAITYPPTALRDDADGWVQMTLNIAEDGSVRDVVVIDSFGGDVFRDSARAAVAQWRYQTRANDGSAYATYGVTVDIAYAIDRGGKLQSSAKFDRAMDQFKSLWPDHKAEAAAALENARTLALSVGDRAILSFNSALAAEAAGDLRRALYHIRHALAKWNGESLDQYIGKTLAARAMRFRAELEGADGNLRGAVCLFERSKPLGVPEGYGNRTETLVAGMLARLNDPKPMAVPGLVYAQEENELGPVWVHQLTRPNFSLADISGALGMVRLVCSSSVQERPAAQVGRWRVPGEARLCAVHVFGTPGSTFKLTEEW